MLTKTCGQMSICYRKMLFGISLFVGQRYKFFLFPRKILEHSRLLITQCFLCFFFFLSGFLLCCSKHMLRGLFAYYNSTVGKLGWFTKYYSSSKAQTLRKSNWIWAGKKWAHTKIYILFCFQHQFCHKNVAVQLLCVYINYLQILTITDFILIGRILYLFGHNYASQQNICAELMLYSYFNELEQGLANPRASSVTSICLHIIFMPGVIQTAKFEGTAPKDCSHFWCQLKVWEVPKTTLKFDNSLEGFIELT